MARLDKRPPSGPPQSPPGSPRPPRSPFLGPEPRPPWPTAGPRLQQRATAGLLLAVLSLVAMMLIGNLERGATVAAVALVVALTALVLVVPARRAARRAGTAMPRGAAVGLVLGVVGALFSGTALIGFTVFGPQVDQYASCLSAATSGSAQQACQSQLEHALSRRLGATRP